MKTSLSNLSNLSLSILLVIQDNQTANKNLKSRVSTQIAFRLFIKKNWLNLTIDLMNPRGEFNR